jgi:DNA (cytosine-5)-methyltransferase 1
MREIAAVRGTNGYTVVSTFSGCGGSCLGFEMAGFKIVWASEFNAVARQSYVLNHPGVILDPRDIRDVQPEDILERIGRRRGEIDVLEGSPPCSSFSLAGKREKLWGKKKLYSGIRQRTDDLFFEYVRILDGLRPRIFIAENVPGLIIGKAKGYFKLILRAMRECGYKVEAKVLDAQWLGVPQARRRVIFMGSLGQGRIRWPRPLPWRYSVREAFELNVESGIRKPLSERMTKWWRNTKPGRTLDEGSTAIGDNDSGFTKRKLDWDRPSSTLTCDYLDVLHPDIPASLTIPEAKRVGSFPDDFRLEGTMAQQYERIARSVPPLMAMHIAKGVESMLRDFGRSAHSENSEGAQGD